MVTRTLQSGPLDDYAIPRICHRKHLPSGGGFFALEEPLCEVGPSSRCPAPKNMPIFLDVRKTSCKSVALHRYRSLDMEEFDKAFISTVDDPFLLVDDEESNEPSNVDKKAVEQCDDLLSLKDIVKKNLIDGELLVFSRLLSPPRTHIKL
ncbi:hypothetical protein PsorP6_005903 [Peronosclerospora sorghi]|uniref:Uncharacterized protein n=1 Tax=Peronosclerospora sorghi TaxID=230839 RepID=A0ACC0W8B2_9STRA|nr:hypothetical protein PsorP6_005903 [Peronosclerospora sorghi]